VENAEVETKLYLKYDLTDDIMNNKVYGILRNYPGKNQVIAKCTARNKAFMIPYKVDNSVAMQNELLGILGEDCVKIKIPAGLNVSVKGAEHSVCKDFVNLKMKKGQKATVRFI
jgi:hypothetical protein